MKPTPTPALGWNHPSVQNAFALGLLLMSFVFNFFIAQKASLTYDEPMHVLYGCRTLNGNTSRFDDSKMPVSALNAIPILLERHRLLSKKVVISQDTAAELSKTGRIVTVTFACLLGALVFIWSRALFGFWAGVLSLSLFIFDPNLQGHATWVSTDLFAAFGVTLTLYSFWRYYRSPSYRTASWAGLSLGAAQLMKFSLVYLYPILLILGLTLLVRAGKRNRNSFSLWRVWLHAALILLLSLVALNAGYVFNGTGFRLVDYFFRSSFFETLQKWPWLNRIPLPFPRPFLEGLDWVKYNEISGANRGPAYLFGQTSMTGFPFYYAYAYLFKIPLGAIALGLLALFGRRKTKPFFPDDELFLILPSAFYATLFVFFLKAQLGIRIAMVFFPLLHIFCGRVALDWPSFSRRGKMLILSLLVYVAVSTVSYYPHWVAYTNELARPFGGGYQILSDSNIDMGEKRPALDRFLRDNPDVLMNPQNPIPGRIVIPVNFLTNVMYPMSPATKAWHSWILHHKRPEKVVAHSYCVFRMTKADILDCLKAVLASISSGSGPRPGA